jgi:hypothetical protein
MTDHVHISRPREHPHNTGEDLGDTAAAGAR